MSAPHVTRRDDDQIVEWGIGRASELLGLVDGSYPDDRLTLDELVSSCWDAPSTSKQVVCGFEDGSGALAMSTDGVIAVIELVVTDGDQPSSTWNELVERAIAIARSWGMHQVAVGGSVPDHLFPGLTEYEAPLMAALESCGFVRSGVVDVPAVLTTFRADPPDGIRIDRPIDRNLVASTSDWIDDVVPSWSTMIDRAIQQATCVVAVDVVSESVVGVAVHSVGRDGWIGPVLVSPGARGSGVGSALVASACRDLMVAGWSQAPLACRPPGPGRDGAGAETIEPHWPARLLDRLDARPWRSFQRWAFHLSNLE